MKLIDLLNESFREYHRGRGGRFASIQKVEDFLYKEDFCIELLYHYLDLGTASIHRKDFLFDNIYRCQHIFVTFLLGFGIAKRFCLLDKVNSINKMPDEYLWMLTSIIHDYGYLKKGLSEDVKIEDADRKYKLLSDENFSNELRITKDYSTKYPQYLTYSYDTIKKYYEYRRKNRYGYNIDHEFVDHGIYGACKCYEEYCDFYIKHEYPHSCISKDDDPEVIKGMGHEFYRVSPNLEAVQLARTEPLLYKTACLITAQHNMFRSSNIENDKVYNNYGLSQLLSTTPILVNIKNPLLYLLSIVDTIECSKRFEKIILSKECCSNKCKVFRLGIDRVLENIDIVFNANNIIIDYSPLKRRIDNYKCLFWWKSKKRKELLQGIFERHLKNVEELQSWVDCKSTRNGNAINIELKR